MKNNTYDIYKKYFSKYILNNNDIDPIVFFSEIINIIDISLEKKEMTEDNIFFKNKILKNKNIMKNICDFLNLICKDVFIELGYKEYNNNIWILNL